MTNLCFDFGALLFALVLFVDDSLTTVTGLEGREFLDGAMTMGFFFFFIPMTMPPDFFILYCSYDLCTLLCCDMADKKHWPKQWR